MSASGDAPSLLPRHVVSEPGAGPSAAPPLQSSESDDDLSLSRLISFFAYEQSAYGNFSAHVKSRVDWYVERVRELFQRDYDVTVVSNANGCIASTYPPELLVLNPRVPEASNEQDETALAGDEDDVLDEACLYGEDGSLPPADVEIVNDAHEVEDLLIKARFNRVRGRFPFPVILCRGKNVIRSSTICILGESILNNLHARSRDLFGSVYARFTASPTHSTVSETDVTTAPPETLDPTSASAPPSASSPTHRAPTSPTVAGGSLLSIQGHREADVALLKVLSTRYIFDLMVEERKRKLGLSVTSSEKVERDTYESFHINPIPYPGCEFFTDYKHNGHCSDNLVFDWSQSFIDAQLALTPAATLGGVDWTQYRTWDLTVLTQRYLLVILNSLRDADPKSSVLVHCISGWDRTPLFISLLRLSLWADGEAHEHLNAEEMLFLTLAYDWMLFGHQLANRLKKGEDILYFCFEFLQSIIGPEFSLGEPEHRTPEHGVPIPGSCQRRRRGPQSSPSALSPSPGSSFPRAGSWQLVDSDNDEAEFFRRMSQDDGATRTELAPSDDEATGAGAAGQDIDSSLLDPDVLSQMTPAEARQLRRKTRLLAVQRLFFAAYHDAIRNDAQESANPSETDAGDNQPPSSTSSGDDVGSVDEDAPLADDNAQPDGDDGEAATPVASEDDADNGAPPAAAQQERRSSGLLAWIGLSS